MRTELWQIVKDLSGIDNVLWSNGDQEFTGRPLITLQARLTSAGNHDYSPPDEFGIATVGQDQDVTLSIQYYDDSLPYSAFDALQTIRNKLELIGTQQAIREAGLAYVQILQDVTDAPAITGTTWESRAIMDVQLRTLTQQTDDVGLIESVRIAGTVNDNIPVTIEV